jgi:hypothetical protein
MVDLSRKELKPEDFLHFVETSEFTRQWEALGFDCEHDLLALQLQIMRTPNVGKVIAGTGGLGKMRFARASDRIGKRGGVRVCYVRFPDQAILLLVTAYGKSERDDLTVDQKKSIRSYIERTRSVLDRRKGMKE